MEKPVTDGMSCLYIGMYDLTARELIVPVQYDYIALFDNVILAVSGMVWHEGSDMSLYGYDGELLYKTAGKSIYFANTFYYLNVNDSDYTFVADTGELYRVPISELSETMDLWDAYSVFHEPIHGNVMGVWLEHEGEIVVPLGVYERLTEHPPFVIAHRDATYEGSMSNDFDILNYRGELLAHNPLDAVLFPRFPDAMVVWLDEVTCVIMDAYGGRIVVEGAPEVRLSDYRTLQ
jgi:hypothetical protein